MLPPAKHPHPKWLADAIFYEIYPQSFVDSNGDGIGDIPGITLKLDYIKDLGCNAIWLNPCFDSPFKDAGYDVRDYKKVASRYGTNDDLIALFDAAHRRDMHVILDLVPGHTSEEHEWFHRSCKVERNNYSDRYIWTDSWISGGDGLPFIGGESPRNGTYILNFFKCQPALNYGFAHPERSWQKPALGPDAKATCDAMVDVMRFWLSRGADGFRVDMADSLVKKDDEGKPYTIRTWQYMFARIRPAFPEAAFVSEWGRPEESMAAGFDIKPTQSAICSVMLYDAKLSQDFAARLQDEGIFVTGFYYPVVPKGQARIRVQVSAGHTTEQLDRCIAAFVKIGKEMNVIK